VVEYPIKNVTPCTCHDEHQVMYRIVESQYCTPETDITLCFTYSRFKKKKECYSMCKKITVIITIYLFLFVYA